MDAIEKYRQRRKLRLDINAHQKRKTERAKGDIKETLDNFKNYGIINADEDWKEELHPRGKGGKFAKKGSGSPISSESGEDKHSKHHHHHKEHVSGGSKLAFNSPEAVELHKRLKAGDYLPLEELVKHPVVKLLGKKAKYYKEKYGSTEAINTPERMNLRRKIKRDYLKTGSARVVEEDGKKKTVYDGPLKKEFKACIVIGLAAAGKSSQIVEPYSAEHGAFVSDCDRINEEIPEYQETNGGAANCVHREARHLSESALKEFGKGGKMNGTNVVIPIIGAWMPELKKKIQMLEDGGYDVEIKYQDATPTESANRMVMRAIETGSIVPLGNVEKNGEEPKKNWEEIRKWGNGKYVKS